MGYIIREYYPGVTVMAGGPDIRITLNKEGKIKGYKRNGSFSERVEGEKVKGVFIACMEITARHARFLFPDSLLGEMAAIVEGKEFYDMIANLMERIAKEDPNLICSNQHNGCTGVRLAAGCNIWQNENIFEIELAIRGEDAVVITICKTGEISCIQAESRETLTGWPVERRLGCIRRGVSIYLGHLDNKGS